jgi:hypothetical protein
MKKITLLKTLTIALFLLMGVGNAWGQATLPLSRTTWNTAAPTGWTDNGTGSYTSLFACTGDNSGKLDSSGDYYQVNFDASPGELIFKLKSASMSGESKLAVEESADGISWTSIGDYGTCGSCIAITDCDDITLTLNSSSRYVKWTYTKASGNCVFDDVSIASGGSSPTITVTPSTLTGFTYLVGNGPSAEQSFTVEGSNLTNDISIIAPTNYEISETSGSGYTSPITLTQSGGSVSSTIYVRLKAGLSAGTYNGEDITCSSNGATNKSITCDGEVTSPEPPTSFTAAANGSDQIDLSWTINSNGNNVLVVFNLNGNFTEPEDGNSYSGEALGGTVIYNSNGTSYSHAGIDDNTTYYYKAWSVDANNNYSSGEVTNATTPKSEPTNHADNFTAEAYGSNQIDLTWNDNDGAQPADGFLIVGKTGAGIFYVPVDETDPADDTDWSDNNFNVKVAHGVGEYSVTGLNAETQYDFQIYPYTNSGSDIDYLTDPTIPTASAETDIAPSIIDFDTDGNWTGSGSLTSYSSDHIYTENNWTFTGGPALRNGIAAQDGYTGALGTYSWRLRDASVTWTATYTATLNANQNFTGFGFDARRWDDDPSPAYTVDYSVDGGSNWTTATSIGTSGVLDNAAFGNSSDWSTFSQTISSPSGLAANHLVVRLSATGGERIMVDNFTYEITTTESPIASTYTGTGNWDDTENWSDGLPGATTDVTVNGNLTVNDAFECNNLTIAPTGTVTVGADQGLIVYGDLHLKSPSGNGAAASFIDEGTTLVGGNYIIERHINAYTTDEDGWHLLASPFAEDMAIAGSDFAPVEGDDDLYGWDEPDFTWLNYFQGNPTNFEAGKGYLVAYKSSATMRDFTADSDNNAHLVSDVDLIDNASRTNDGGWHLVGNSFLSAVTWDTDNEDWFADNIEASAQILDVDQSGNYLAVDKGETIQALQGFFVRVTAHGDNLLMLPASARTHSTGNFVKSSTQNALELKVTNDKNGYFDKTKVKILEGATQAYDADVDGSKLKGFTTAPQLYTVSSDDKELSINVISNNDNEVQMPLHFEARFDAAYTIQVEDNTLPEGVTIFMTDLVLNQEINLNTNPTYTFTASEGDNPNRFLLHFGAVGLDENAGQNSLRAYTHHNTLYVQNSLEDAAIRVIDLQGRLLLEQKLNGTGLQSLPLDFPAGVYMVQLLNSKEQKSVKVIVE